MKSDLFEQLKGNIVKINLQREIETLYQTMQPIFDKYIPADTKKHYSKNIHPCVGSALCVFPPGRVKILKRQLDEYQQQYEFYERMQREIVTNAFKTDDELYEYDIQITIKRNET